MDIKIKDSVYDCRECSFFERDRSDETTVTKCKFLNKPLEAEPNGRVKYDRDCNLCGGDMIYKNETISSAMFETILKHSEEDLKPDADWHTQRLNRFYKDPEVIFINCIIELTNENNWLSMGMQKRTFINCKFLVDKDCQSLSCNNKLYNKCNTTFTRCEFILTDEHKSFHLGETVVNHLIIGESFINKELALDDVHGTITFNHWRKVTDGNFSLKELWLRDSNIFEDHPSSLYGIEKLYMSKSSIRFADYSPNILNIEVGIHNEENSSFMGSEGGSFAVLGQSDIKGAITTINLAEKLLKPHTWLDETDRIDYECFNVSLEDDYNDML